MSEHPNEPTLSGTNYGELEFKVHVEEQTVQATPVVPVVHPGGIEREVFGKWTVILRNIGGALAVLTTCIAAMFNAYTTNLSVSSNQGWPSEFSMLIMNVGTVIVAWTWINANKTLSTLMELSPMSNKIRGKMADIIAPKPRGGPGDDTQ